MKRLVLDFYEDPVGPLSTETHIFILVINLQYNVSIKAYLSNLDKFLEIRIEILKLLTEITEEYINNNII